MVTFKINKFTLIEIALALAIVVLSLVAILPLITYGLKDSKDLASDTYVSETSEQFLNYISLQTKIYWSDYLGDSDPSLYISSFTEKGQKLEDWNEQDIKDWQQLSGAWENIYKTNNPDIYGIKQVTSEITDFIGVIRVWKSPVTLQNKWGEKEVDSDYKYSARLNIEISWPAEIPYKNRDKKYFYLEVFNPN